MSVSTLFIGIGGQGGKVVRTIAKKVTQAQAEDVEFVVLDTDVNDLDEMHRQDQRIATIQTSYRATVGAALDANADAREKWFPVTPGLLGKSLTEGAGQVRAISRLAFDHAVANGKMRPIEKAIERLRSLRGDPYEQSLRITICGSIAGGTGSGIALPLAMYIRNYLITRYQDQSTIIRGFFLDPDTLHDVIKDDEERSNQNCNAYAAIREIDAFLRKQYTQESGAEYAHVVFNAPQPGVGRRMDYPNILPYNYVFLMDRLNVDSESLDTMDDYLDHMADIIFTQSIGTTAARSNSMEDNFTRRLNHSQGRARYCGAGCSHLVYPYDTVRRYIGLKWSVSAITGEWLELDHTYLKELREGDVEDSDLERAKSYRRNFDLRRMQSKFYSNLGKDAKIAVKKRKRDGSTVDEEKSIGRAFVEALMAFSSSWNESGLRANCGALDAFETENAHRSLFRTPEQVREQANSFASAWRSVLDRQLADYDERSFRYYNIVTSDVVDTAGHFARRLFDTPQTEDNPLKMLRDPHYIEYYLSKKDGAGAKHPIVVRYILSDAIIELSDKLEELTGKRNGAQDTLGKRYNSERRYAEKGQTAAPEQGGGNPIDQIKRMANDMQGKATVSDAEADQYASNGNSLVGRRRTIDEYRSLCVTCSILEAALQHVISVADGYKGFFNYMDGQIPELEDEATGIEDDPRYNVAKGSPTRYVCASKPCLQHMLAECPQAGSSVALPPELCADIYRGVVRFMALNHDNLSKEEQVRVGKVAYAELFQQTVVDYWTYRLEDPSLGYASVVDKTVLQAILDELRYSDPDGVLDPTLGDQRLRGHLTDVIRGAFDLAQPYIMRPIDLEGEEKPSTASACVYDESILKGLGAFSKDAENLLQSVNGKGVSTGEVDRHELRFYRSIYGFRASHLPHYACAHTGNESRPEGEYHRSYWSLVRSLSPDTRRNIAITPHIDRHWHLISYLPDISDDFQRELYEQIIQAFVYGLVWRQFGDDVARDGSRVFYLKTQGRGRKQVELLTADGTRCDKFYEVFDALKLDPQVVEELTRRSEESIQSELRNLSIVRPEYSGLVSEVHSHAFGDVPSVDEILGEIKLFSADRLALCGRYAFTDEEQVAFFTNAVKMFFRPSNRNEDPELLRRRHSLFEIPVFYRISLPPQLLRSSEIEDMVEGIYAFIRSYFSHFANTADEEDLDYICGTFVKEQYLLFEKNLPVIEASFPETAWSTAVSAVREKVASFFDAYSELGREFSKATDVFSQRWSEVLKDKDAAMKQQGADQTVAAG